MATAAVLAPHDVPTILNYYTPIGTEEPYQYVQEPPAGKPSNNLGLEPRPVTVHDARGREQDFSLDKTGFQYINWPSVEKGKDFTDDERIKNVYYPEVEEILKKVAGANRVFIFDHTIRRNVDGVQDGRLNRGPVERVHIDQTYNASVERVKYHLPEEADKLLKGRVRIINVWRPIQNPVAHKPLAVSDWRHLSEKDLVSVHFIYPHRTGSTYSVRYNPEHQWYYLSGQTPDEVTLIKCFDSKDDRARLTPHSAFLDADTPKELPHRQSIEVRALVFSDE